MGNGRPLIVATGCTHHGDHGLKGGPNPFGAGEKRTRTAYNKTIPYRFIPVNEKAVALRG
jgi:hypothetical protein